MGKAMEKFKNFLKWNYSDIDDIFFKSEVKANKIVAVSMLNSAIILIIGMILGAANVFNVTSGSFNSALWQGTIELLIPSILCFILKGRKKWLKYLLMFGSILVITRVDMVLTFNVTLFMVIPVVLSCRYYSKSFSTIVCITSMICLVGSTLLWKYTQVLPDFNIFKYKEIAEMLVLKEDGTYDVILRDDYTMRVLFSDCLPRLLLFANISIIAIASAARGREMIEEQSSVIKKTSRIEYELNLAKNIQAAMLPSIFPPYPEKSEFDLYALMNPAKEVGGDFYDFFMLDDKKIALVAADVSGKGVPAALFMVIAKTLIKNQAQSGLSPAEVLSKVNQMLCEGNSLGLFVTCFICYFDSETGLLTYSNAGHNPPLITNEFVNNEGNKTYKYDFIRTKPGFVLGGIEGIKYKNSTIELVPNDKIFLYTDGVTEAKNDKDELFGEERLIEYLNSHSFNNPKELITALREEINVYANNAEQFDDITMLAFDFKKYFKTNAIEREFKASDESLDAINDFLEEELNKYNASMKLIKQINVVTEEVFTNISHYAYNENIGKMRLSVEYKDGDIILKFIDYGIPFNPLLKKDPDISLSANERQIGGLGIFMVKKIMDEAKYKYENGQNILILRKSIEEKN